MRAAADLLASGFTAPPGTGVAEGVPPRPVVEAGLAPVPRSRWQEDSAASRCPGEGCPAPEFTLTRRRHHCRACGMVFCDRCSPETPVISAGMAPKTGLVGLEFGQPTPTVQVELADGMLRFGDSIASSGGASSGDDRVYDVRGCAVERVEQRRTLRIMTRDDGGAAAGAGAASAAPPPRGKLKAIQTAVGRGRDAEGEAEAVAVIEPGTEELVEEWEALLQCQVRDQARARAARTLPIALPAHALRPSAMVAGARPRADVRQVLGEDVGGLVRAAGARAAARQLARRLSSVFWSDEEGSCVCFPMLSAYPCRHQH